MAKPGNSLEIPVLMSDWRDTARDVRVFGVSALATAPFLLFLFHISYWTLGLAVTSVAVLTVLDRFSFSVPVGLAALRALIAGRNVSRTRRIGGRELRR